MRSVVGLKNRQRERSASIRFKERLYVLGTQDYSDGGLGPAPGGAGKEPLISSL
jgi:hypothetical protein